MYTFRYVGDDRKPSPGTGNADSAGGKFDIAKSLVELNSESYYERCDAQSALAKAGDAGLAGLTDALNRGNIGPRGRLHAVWLLAHLRGQQAQDDLVRIAKTDKDLSVRAQAVRVLADLSDPVLARHRLDAGRGDEGLARSLAALAERQDERLLLDIVVALGRLRWAGTAEWLRTNLHNPDATLAHAAMQALRRSQNWPTVFALVDSRDNEPLRAIALSALAEQCEPAVARGLIERLRDEPDANRRRQYAGLLARTYKRPGPWIYWGYRPPPRPANAQSWEWTEAIAAALDRALADPDPEVRLFVLQRMQREKAPAQLKTLGSWLAQEREPVRVAALLAALRDWPAADVQPYVEAVVHDERQSAVNRQAALALLDRELGDMAEPLVTLVREIKDGPLLADALRRLGKHRPPTAAGILADKLGSPAAQVRAAAIEALGEMGAEEGRTRTAALLADENPLVRRAAAVAAGRLAARQATEPLLKAAADSDSSVRRAAFEALTQLKDLRAVLPAAAALGDPEVQLAALACLAELGGPEHATKIADLARQVPSSDLLLAAIRALSTWREREGLPDAAREELDRAVAEIHGASGTLVRWRGRGPLTAKEAGSQVERLTTADTTEFTAGWRNLLAAGTESRIVLASKTAKEDIWLAFADVAVHEPTPVEFLGGSSGSSEVWLNGRLLFRQELAGPLQADSLRFAGVLAAGTNRLLVRMGSTAGPAEFQLRFRRKSAAAEHERLAQAALSRPGNAERGRLVLFNVDKSQCLKCHRLEDKGERIGPELTGLGSRFPRIHVIESILEPSRTIAPSFGTTIVVLSDGTTFSGVKIAETESSMTLADNQGRKRDFPKADIEIARPSPTSTMPEGLEKRITEEEFVDLIAYLLSQKGSR
jgi:putative heme-binding domain-containing protein